MDGGVRNTVTFMGGLGYRVMTAGAGRTNLPTYLPTWILDGGEDMVDHFRPPRSNLTTSPLLIGGFDPPCPLRQDVLLGAVGR